MYGIKVGKPNYEKNSQLKTQEHLASDMGMDVRTLQNYKLLAEMIPELSDSLNQEQLDTLSSTGFQYVTFCHVLKQLSHCMEKTITGYRHSQRKLCRYSS